MILVDTSVWVDHLRRGNPRLEKLLMSERILCHPLIIGELACGNLHDRASVLELLRALPESKYASQEETHHLIENNKLWGQGLGWIDVVLLASALISGVELWTLDKKLDHFAQRLQVAS
jgi:predicted nucleic acid-binding protein